MGADKEVRGYVLYMHFNQKKIKRGNMDGGNRPFPNRSTSSPGANLQLRQISIGIVLAGGDHINDIDG